MRSVAILSLLLPATAFASPVVDEKALKALFCKVNNIVITALQKDTVATSYCSSFLSIPTSTVYTTVTQTPASITTTADATITDPAVTVTTEEYFTVPSDTTTTFTNVVTEFATVSTTSTTTLTCLDSAYTNTPPAAAIVDSPPAAKRAAKFEKPKVIPIAWPAAYVSTACSCLSIPTPTITKTASQTLAAGTVTITNTITVTPTATETLSLTVTSINIISTTVQETTTSTVTAYATATTIAPNGLKYRKYTHSFNANLANSGFTSSFFKGRTADLTGTLNSLSFSSNGGTNLNLAGQSFNALQAAVLEQGFFIASQAGTYTFTSPGDQVDNWSYLWLGDVAYSAWDDSNTSFKSSRTASAAGGNQLSLITGTTTVELKAGDAIPLSYLWANGGGPSNSRVTISVGGSAAVEQYVQACSATSFP